MDPIIVDVREPSEYSQGHVAGALNIPPAAIMSGAKELNGLEKGAEIVLYCVSGSRSNVSMHILQSKGFTNLKNGINAQQVAAKYNLDIVH
ncbi:rhodanese-like domain-containing protein [Candidatus Saccharibacteria bacterium]|nr:rhodanese-like domain-containing protein [Candidatus Saccharibacteria bacterium]